MPPHYYSTLIASIFAEWGLVKANTRRGVFRVENNIVSSSLRRQRSLVPESGENCMKEATKRAASEALAQMLAVTAMLVIASFVFYWR
jgi:hypothetical protein